MISPYAAQPNTSFMEVTPSVVSRIAMVRGTHSGVSNEYSLALAGGSARSLGASGDCGGVQNLESDPHAPVIYSARKEPIRDDSRFHKKRISEEMP